MPDKEALSNIHHNLLQAFILVVCGLEDLLAQLLALNLAVAAKIESHQSVTAPGIPPGYPAAANLVTEDCIRAS